MLKKIDELLKREAARSIFFNLEGFTVLYNWLV